MSEPLYIKYPDVYSRCPRCFGKGKESCPYCSGNGRTYEYTQVYDYYLSEYRSEYSLVLCSYCAGQGYRICSSCAGTGSVKHQGAVGEFKPSGEEPSKVKPSKEEKIPAVDAIPVNRDLGRRLISFSVVDYNLVKKAKKAAARLLASDPNNQEAKKFKTLYKELVEIAAKEAYLRDLLSAKLPGGRMLKLRDPDFSGVKPSFIAAYKQRESELTKIREQKENLMKEIIKRLLDLSSFY